MRVVLRTSYGTEGLRALAWAERLLVLAGAAVLGWCALVVVERHVSQQLAHESLVTMPRVAPPAVRRAPPAIGTPLANLSIPRIHLSAVVLHGSDARTLRVGVGHIENTALPGEPGNVAIAGHRDSFFRPLQNVRVGDDVVLDTPQGRWHYRVSSLRVVPPSEISVLNPTANATLTLVTCYPFWIFGRAPDRFVVRATRVADPTTDAQPALVSRPREEAPAPVIERPASSSRASASTRSRLINSKDREASDNEALVRQAIDRFRVAYNARLISHGEIGSGGLLTFQACHVVFDGDDATATCQTASRSPESLEALEPMFTLRNAGGAWAIKSVALLP